MRVCFDASAVNTNFICTSQFVAYFTPWYWCGFGNIGFMEYYRSSNSIVKGHIICICFSQERKQNKSVLKIEFMGLSEYSFKGYQHFLVILGNLQQNRRVLSRILYKNNNYSKKTIKNFDEILKKFQKLWKNFELESLFRKKL